MNEYGSNGRRNNVIGNGSQINRSIRPEQRRPARQFSSEEEYISRERHVSQTMRTQSSNTQNNIRQRRRYEDEYNISYNERDYLPPRRNEVQSSDKRKRYSNISRDNVNAGYESVSGRVRRKEKDFDDYNFDLNQDFDFNQPTRRSREKQTNFNQPTHRSREKQTNFNQPTHRSREKQIYFNANDFDDFDADELFDSFDIDEYGNVSKKEYDDARESDRKARKSKRKQDDDTKNKKSDLVFLIVACFEAALSIFFIILLLMVDLLPTLYLALAIALLVLIAAGLIITQIKKINKNKKLRIAGRIVCIFMCVVLIVGSYFLALTKKAIDTVSNETGYTINQVHVAVLASDSATSLKDLKNETFGTISTFKPLILNEAMKDFEKQVGSKLKTKDYTNVFDLVESLYSKESRVIIFNNDLKGDIVEKHENFDKEVKIIYTFKSKTKINIKTNTDVDVTTQPFLFYISGNDEYGELSVGGRSDVNMLVAVNPISHEVLLVSIPRDYYVTFAGVSGTARDKITHAGIYGTDTQCATIAELYGYDVDFYCVVNFSSLIEIVDAIGGVDIDCEADFISIDGYEYHQGPMHLDGTYALHYVRERQAFEDGDFARGRHQQQVIKAIIDKLLSTTGLTAYSQLVNTLERVCTTSIPKESISALVKKQLAEGGSWNISSIQAEGVPMTQPSYASGGIGLSVVMPYSGSIALIKEVMGQLYAGEPVQARQMNDNDDWSYVITPLPVPEDSDEEEEQTKKETSEEDTDTEEGADTEETEEDTEEDPGIIEEET